jgi:hypothetical protein
MALLAFNGPVPSSGLGNIGATFGPPNAPGAMAPTPPMRANTGPTMRPMPMPGQYGGGQASGPVGAPAAPMAGTPSIGNMGMPAGVAGGIAPMSGQSQQPQPPSAGPVAGGLGSIFSQMDPQHAAAIRGIPQRAMQALHSAGMIHPELMRHLYGGAQR